jgi:hypothetical protein
MWQAPCPYGPAMKLIFDSLDAMLKEVRERKVEVVRVSPAISAGASLMTDAASRWPGNAGIFDDLFMTGLRG